MQAVIETGGKQYFVKQGDVFFTEKLPVSEGETVVVDRVLALKKDDKMQAGNPVVPGAVVKLKVLEQGKGKKIIVFKYKPKKNYRRKQGHRQSYSRVLVEEIKAE